jgi:hypothetical protein
LIRLRRPRSAGSTCSTMIASISTAPSAHPVHPLLTTYVSSAPRLVTLRASTRRCTTGSSVTK